MFGHLILKGGHLGVPPLVFLSIRPKITNKDRSEEDIEEDLKTYRGRSEDRFRGGSKELERQKDLFRFPVSHIFSTCWLSSLIIFVSSSSCLFTFFLLAHILA